MEHVFTASFAHSLTKGITHYKKNSVFWVSMKILDGDIWSTLTFSSWAAIVLNCMILMWTQYRSILLIYRLIKIIQLWVCNIYFIFSEDLIHNKYMDFKSWRQSNKYRDCKSRRSFLRYFWWFCEPICFKTLWFCQSILLLIFYK